MTVSQIAHQMSVPVGKVVMAASRAEQVSVEGEYSVEAVSVIVEEIKSYM